MASKPDTSALEWRLKAPLNEELYGLAEDEQVFYANQTGIDDEQALKEHILRVQAEAYEIFPYPCIRRFSFTKLKISRYPAYKELLRLGAERPGALFLDIGCCFGNDVRKAVADGFPQNQALASDLRPEFWDLGHKLFCSTPQSFPIPFLQGDVFDPGFLRAEPPARSLSEAMLPSLTELKSLNPLLGRISAIHASAFFHLFDEGKQLELAKLLAGLLSPEPGTIIFGSHVGSSAQGYKLSKNNAKLSGMFCHDLESWRELWEKTVFQEGEVKVWSILKEIQRADLAHYHFPGEKLYLMIWSVTRV